ncbi:MAG: F0F1 ATP synthase subunit A [Caulobacteraceae bacterium]
MAAIDPLHQFAIEKMVTLPTVNLGGVAIDLSITNSVAAMMIAAVAICVFFALSAKGEVVPGRLQTAGESVYGLVEGLTSSMIGHEGKKYFPFVFTLFTFIMFMNLFGLMNFIGVEHLRMFTPTSQVAVTATLALITIGLVIIVGFVKNGLGFFKLFVPSGVPVFILPFLVVIEVISFLVRPITLTLRLFGNMLGGHVVLAIFGSFVAALGAYALSSGGAAYAALIPSALSFVMVVALTALEFIVGFLQAFVFAALACVYLNDVVNLGHGH